MKNLRQHARNRIRGLLQAYGTTSLKRQLWDSEFSEGRWSCLDATAGDCVYPFVERLARHGCILDLGCGSGNTGNELNRDAYRLYVGVDVSDVAIAKARQRSEENQRASHNRFLQSDILTYAPGQLFNVILFRDSIYYIPHHRIPAMLERYAKSLEPAGVFIVRMASGSARYQQIVDDIESRFEVIEKESFAEPDAVVLVFRAGKKESRRAFTAGSRCSR